MLEGFACLTHSCHDYLLVILEFLGCILKVKAKPAH